MKKIELTHSAWKAVGCEYCQTKFSYTLSRTVKQEWDDDKTKAKAKEAALDLKKKLISALQNGIEAVPCPGCARYQTAMLATLKKSHGAGLLALCAGTFLMSALLTLLYALNRLASGPTDDASMTQGLSWTVSLWIILALLASTALLRRRFFDPAVQSDAALATRLIRRNMLRVDAPAPAGPKPRQQRASPGPTLAAAGALGAGVALAAGFSKQVSEQLPPLNDSPDPDPDIQPATPMDHDLTATASSVPHSHPERPDLVDPPIHHSGFHSVDTATTWSQDDVIDMPDLDESIAKAADLPDLHGSWVAAPNGPDIPDLGDLDDAIASAVGLSDVSELAEISDIATETVGDALKDALS